MNYTKGSDFIYLSNYELVPLKRLIGFNKFKDAIMISFELEVLSQ